MRVFLEKVIYFTITFFIFMGLWKLVAILWGAMVPWNYKTDLLAVFIVIPLMIGLSFILSSTVFKIIRESK